MTDKNDSIEQILEERARLDSLLKEHFSRQVAIMFTDIKGSTAYYEIHGDIDGRLMVHRHNEIVLPVISENRGTLLKTIGDATMSAYDDPADAVRCAISIQEKLRDYNSDKQDRDQIQVRIGLNYGVAIVEESDVYGDVVNLASRVESLADGGQIMVSEEVYRAVRNEEEFIFRYVDEVKVKGKQEKVKVYRLAWHQEELHLGKTRSSSVAAKKEGVYVMEVSLSGYRLKVSGFERSEGGERTVKSYREMDFHEDRIRGTIRELTALLNNSNRRGKIGNDLLIRLRELGALLYDELIPKEIKEALSKTHEKHLLISLDDSLVHIPWELLYDGRDFLCRRFSVGRSVSTKQAVSAVARSVARPVKMQVLADPRGDLAAAYEEGMAIKGEMEKLDDWVDFSLRTTEIRTDYVRSKIRNFDILHYAGHAEHSSQHPEESGWLLRDGKLTAGQVMTMTGQIPMPALIFSNACQSGQTDEWRLADDYESRIFGLANAFLLTGVQHYIGTFWEIPDEAGCHFAVSFYRSLIDGEAIGESLRLARLALIEKYGEDTIVWATYMLYGDPTSRYIDVAHEALRSEQRQKTIKDDFVTVDDKEDARVIKIPEKKAGTSAYLATAAVIVFALLAGFYILRPKAPEQQTLQHIQLPQTADQDKSGKRIDELVAALASDFRSGRTETRLHGTAATSELMTLFVTDIKTSGNVADDARDTFPNLLAAALQAGGQMQMVERELLEKLLQELKLSRSSLADPATALRLGKVLSAKVIATGSITGDEKGMTVILRLIDTETTAVKKVVSAESKGSRVDRETVNEIGRQITDWVKAEKAATAAGKK